MRAAEPFALGQPHAPQPARGHGPRARDPRGRAAAPRGRRVLAPAGGRRRGDADGRRHGGRSGVDVAAQDHDRGVAPRGGAGDGRARRGDPRRGRGRGLPAGAPRPRDDRRRAMVPPGGPVGGAVAARADAAAAADRRRARRDRRGLPHLGGQRRRRPGSRSSSCTPRTATCSPSSCRPRRTAAPAPGRSPAGSRSWRGSCARSARRLREVVVGIRLSTDGGEEAGLTVDGLCELLPHVSELVDYVNLTVGVRTTYVRDMATEEPPLLGHVGRIRPAGRPAAADLARLPHTGHDRGRPGRRGGPRRHGARADRRSRHAAQAARRPRGGDPAVRRLQRGLPRVRPGPAVLGQPGARRRPAPTAGRPRRWSCAAPPSPPAGAWRSSARDPAGSSARLTLAGRREVVLFDAREAIGGQLAVAARGSQSRRMAGAGGLLRGRARRRVELRLGTAAARGRPRRLRRGRDRDRQHRGPAGAARDRARAAVVGGDRPAPERAQPAGRGRRVRLVAVRERRRARRPRRLRDDHGGDAGRGVRGLAAAGGPRAAARAPARRSARRCARSRRSRASARTARC